MHSLSSKRFGVSREGSTLLQPPKQLLSGNDAREAECRATSGRLAQPQVVILAVGRHGLQAFIGTVAVTLAAIGRLQKGPALCFHLVFLHGGLANRTDRLLWMIPVQTLLKNSSDMPSLGTEAPALYFLTTNHVA